MKNFSSFLVLGLGMGCFSMGALGQARPTASGPGFALPTVGGSLRYSLSTSESLANGLYNRDGIVSSTNITGNVAFITPSPVHPFSLIESGGYIVANSGQPSTFFENLLVSQALQFGRWSVTAADRVDYLPETPSTGLSGVPGVGDLNATPPPVDTPGTGAGLGILSLYGPRLNNSVSLAAARSLTGSLDFQASGTYSMLRYLGGTSAAVNGIDNNSTSGNAGLNYRIDARSRVGATYFYSKSSFPGQQFTFTTQGVNGFYSRQLTRRLSTYVSGGPLKLSSSSGSLSGPSINFGATASVTYAGKEFTQSVHYVRDTSSGSGVIAGDIADSVFYGINRTYGTRLGVAGSVGYARTHSLLDTQPFSSEGVTASAQVTQALSPHVSGFASYTFQRQTVTYATDLTNAFQGTYNVVSFGVTYSPSVHKLGAQ